MGAAARQYYFVKVVHLPEGGSSGLVFGAMTIY